MYAAINGKLECLEHLVAKGANLNVRSLAGPGLAGALPRGRAVPCWRRCAPPPPHRRRTALPPRCRPAAAPLPPRAAGGRPSAAQLVCASRQESERGCAGVWAAWGGLGVGWGGASDTCHPPTVTAHPRVWGHRRISAEYKNTALHWAAYYGRDPCVESLLKAGPWQLRGFDYSLYMGSLT